jgi:hypothetical protein
MGSPKSTDIRTAFLEAMEQEKPEQVMHALSLAALKIREAASRVVGHPIEGMLMVNGHVQWLLEGGCGCRDRHPPDFSEKN